MVSSPVFVAACSLFALSFAAPVRTNVVSRSMVARDAYIMFGGDGTTTTGWPSRKSWLNFEDAWYVSLLYYVCNILIIYQESQPQDDRELMPGRRLGR